MSLPTHQRRRKTFDETFERTAEATIHKMNQSGSDVASQKPLHKLALDRVGIQRKAIPVRIQNPFGKGEPVHLTCQVSAHVGLDGERRGIHVSRLGDVLAQLAPQVFTSLGHYASQVAEAIGRTQQAPSAMVRVEGMFTYLEHLHGVKQKQSLESLKLSAVAELRQGQIQQTNGVQFNHITACPCVQETFRHSYGEDSKALLQEVERHQMPFLTHSQRCLTTVEICGAQDQYCLCQLLETIDGIVTRCQNTMPREFELLTVFNAHQKAQFLEDVLRDLLAGLRNLLKNADRSTRIRLQSVSMESIHDFDLDGETEYTLGELDAFLGS